ncbi:MAG: ATP-dependent DNA helicase RecG [Planctomycetes bacterium]|nr:ATP-dependent DNA helicase RecG [Planctomycetota bacterium]
MPSPLEKLQKCLRLESERNFDNRAVVGGLDKILPIWESEARASEVNEELIREITTRLNSYVANDLQGRENTIKELLLLISAELNASSNVQGNSQKKNPVAELKSDGSCPNDRNNPPIETTSRQTLPKRDSNKAAWGSDSPNTQGLNAPLTVLQGVGPRTAQSLKPLGLETLGDLLYYFPRRYDDYSNLKPINHINYGDELTVIGTIQSISTRPVRGGQMQITEAVIGDGTGFLRLTWFNQPWLAHQIKQESLIVVSGKVDMYLGRLGMNSPDWEHLEQEHLHTNRIVPVYPLTAHVNQRWLRKIMFQTVSFWAPRVPDYLPEDIRNDANLVSLSNALSQVHFPDSNEKLKAARSRLAFDEIFFLQLGVLRQKRTWESVSAQVFETPEEWLEQQIQRLPYQLTNAQNQVLQEVRADLTSGRPMNRLLQGDVGSGKTVVAILAAAIVTHHGAQAAIMAPTSILAEQHYQNILRMLSKTDALPDAPHQPSQIRILVGDTPESEKEEIRSGLADGSIKMIVGTHALIEDPVVFNNLQFVVVDEQHRFGVAQRAILRSKGHNPHLMVMTATPIPRSLALTVYGDLDLSVMDEMPAGRQPIETHVLNPLERERAYQLIRSQVAEGHQAFIIYPLIEKGEREETKAAVDEHARLQADIFPKFKIGLLHGRMRPDDKEHSMAQFRDKEYQILVSTSVVEVGVDVPNATVMLIEGANRFGLSQLHQFRGRVGRGSDKSFCLLIPETEDSVENERLAAMAETNDGFILAERDLDQRGPGDFLGTRQSGFSELKMANLTDIRLIEKARQQALILFEKDPTLSDPEHLALEKTFRRFWGNGRGDIS